MCDGRKIAGVLIENRPVDGNQWCVLVGIGINVNADPAETCPELRSRATSLWKCLHCPSAAPICRERLLAATCQHLQWALSPPNSAEMYAEYKSKSVLLGRKVCVQVGERQQDVAEGSCEGFDEWGRLILRRSDGGMPDTLLLSSGECSLLWQPP